MKTDSNYVWEFDIGATLKVDGTACEIIAREIYDGDEDYLCKPLDSTKSIFGEAHGDSSWARLGNGLDARLATAAPEMLEALKMALAHLPRPSLTDRDAASAAAIRAHVVETLAKARGEK
jgi:hypothetical protein